MNPPIPARRVPAVLLGLLVLVTALLGGAPARADDAPTFFGSVYDASDGSNLGGTSVALYAVDPATHPAASPVLTVVSEEDSFSGAIAAGQYWLVLSRDGYETLTAGPYAIAADGATYLDEFQLQPTARGRLVGSIRLPGGTAATCGSVEVHDAAASAAVVTTVGSDENGDWDVTLPVGRYTVRVGDDCADVSSRWVGGATPTVFEVSDGGSTLVETVALAARLSVTGTVTDASGRPLAGIDVVAEDRDDPVVAIQLATSGRDGSYRLDHLDPGAYVVRFEDPNEDYATQWWSGGSDRASATTLDLTGGRTGVDAALVDAPLGVLSGRIAGRVTDRNGAGVRGVDVVAYGTNGMPTTSVLTRRDGSYAFGSDLLSAGSYRLRFVAAGFRTEWSHDALTSAGAAVVVAPASGTATVDERLVELGSISGTVDLSGSAAAATSEVTLYDVDGQAVAAAAGIADGGTFTLTDLLPGTYHLLTRAADGTTGAQWVREWYSDAFTEGSARAIVVGDGGRVTGIDVGLGQTLTGTTRPVVSGAPRLGATLTASSGRWSLMAETRYSWQWLRAGVPIAGQTSATHTVSAADLGRPLTVRVTARDALDRYLPGTVTSAAVTPRTSATVAVRATGGRRQATLTVVVTARGVPAVSGSLVVREKGRTLRTVAISRGRASVKLRKVAKGRHTYTVVFRGTPAVSPSSRSVTVRVR